MRCWQCASFSFRFQGMCTCLPSAAGGEDGPFRGKLSPKLLHLQQKDMSRLSRLMSRLRAGKKLVSNMCIGMLTLPT